METTPKLIFTVVPLAGSTSGQSLELKKKFTRLNSSPDRYLSNRGNEALNWLEASMNKKRADSAKTGQ